MTNKYTLLFALCFALGSASAQVSTGDLFVNYRPTNTGTALNFAGFGGCNVENGVKLGLGVVNQRFYQNNKQVSNFLALTPQVRKTYKQGFWYVGPSLYELNATNTGFGVELGFFIYK